MNLMVEISGVGQKTDKQFFDSSPILIGKVRENDVILPNELVSSQHARIDWDDQSICVKDLNSKIGTFIGEFRISEARFLCDALKMRVATCEILLRIDRGTPISPGGTRQKTILGARDRIERILPTDADFDSFCLSYFPGIFKRFGAAMNRLQKENTLLDTYQDELDAVLDALASYEQRRSKK
jgi:hypothetical protein